MKYLGLLSFLFLPYVELQGTHIRGGEITYKRISDVTLTMYHDTQSPVRSGDGLINFGDGREVQIDLEASSFEDGLFIGHNQEIEWFRIKIIHTYSAPGSYSVTYMEPNRNDEIVNINHGNGSYANNNQIPFYLESWLVIDQVIGVNNSPEFNTFPVDFGYVGSTFTHNPWAWDPDGDSLAYRLIIPRKHADTLVTNYQKPNDTDFYLSPTNWNFANETGDGPATWKINPFTGDLVWDAPGNFIQNSSGPFSEYNIAFLVEEWRKVEGSWRRIGHVTRDFLIIITPEEIGRPDFTVPDEVMLTTAEIVQETITFHDPDGDPIRVEFFGEVFDLQNSPMQVTPAPGDFTNGPLSLTFEWLPLPEHIRDRPYYVHLKLTDKPQDGQLNPSVTYKTWIITANALPDIVTELDEDQALKQLELFPNPAKNILNWNPINITGGESPKLVVYNSLGQQTISLDLTSSRIREIDISNLPTGLYFVQLYSQKDNYRGVFIKQ